MDDDRGLTQNPAQMNDILHWLTCYFFALVQIGATLSISYLSWTHLHSLALRIVSSPFSGYFCGELWLWRPLDVVRIFPLQPPRSLSGHYHDRDGIIDGSAVFSETSSCLWSCLALHQTQLLVGNPPRRPEVKPGSEDLMFTAVWIIWISWKNNSPNSEIAVGVRILQV